ncbi:facilitated trehalose transporter Tret1-like [Rhopalosiphum padi]|uniref:facilitated trehalose transporter Tret1-like n=1 Tax=Rhopalosiphum padi TaxID=40932 RepID=UPI00298E11E8|nr:facilitated trehalose transporter Tret1-like [Rhopalosiphum padi]XP_060851885.1 facilitated trehalose transporter Tret1-like [Rhopalosiphum padi]XP_060851887.1 facilitated trehalose transporter Tret1-like [Rhopalosiphum padi]XP_060851888.1 facilitated trehalose transporter Tret1-like [Rhopalosiphum padi]XP_060851889.1 facilitated trehalose transporter Tret1-like [Rhopalosiphum padi]XP_060851890.1 facilitated trehalose transporter Tret1-like [Rhopalosiphum padi]
MSNVDQNVKIIADKITTPENNNCNINTTTIISIIDKYGTNDDGQNKLIENNMNAENKTIDVEDEKYSVSSLLWRDLYPQVLASCISLLMVIQPGIHLAYSNNMLHHMPSINKEQFSWITSISVLCTPVGAFFVGLVMDRIGRKNACLLTCLPLLASWTIVTISSTDNIYTCYVFRLLGGIGAGMTTVGLVYVSEISHSSYKQILLSLNSVFFSGGVLLSTCLVDLKWNVINFSFVIFTIVNMALIIIYLPESPIWILKFKSSEHINKAKIAVKQIYPNDNQVFEAEWRRLKSASDDAAGPDVHQPSFFESIRSNPAAYKPMAILTVLLLLQQLTGAYSIISYALPILKSVVPAAYPPAIGIQSLAALGIVRFASGVLACVLSLRVGRKPLLIFSCVAMAMSSVLVAATHHSRDTTAVPWSLCGVMLYVFSSSVGVLVFPWTMICELLSTPVRAVGGCMLVSYAYLIMFTTLKVFPYVLAAVSVPNVFLVFGAVSTSMAVYVHFVVPETLGKSFREIEDYFTRPSKPL